MLCFKKSVCVTIFLATLFCPFFVSADIYRYVDEKGTVHFTNLPTDNRYQLYIQGRKTYRSTKYDSHKYDHLIRKMANKKHRKPLKVPKALAVSPELTSQQSICPLLTSDILLHVVFVHRLSYE